MRTIEQALGAASMAVRTVSLSRSEIGSPEAITSQEARNAATSGIRSCPGTSK
jgi:hypothetical protein